MRPEDTLVFIGDYIDRGPKTSGVLDFLIELKATRPNTVFLRGNHEQMMLDARQRFDPSFDSNNPRNNCELGVYWFEGGGTATVTSYQPAQGRRWYQLIPQAHWDFLLATDMEYRKDAYIFVHAGIIPPGTTWHFGEFDADPRLWIRYEFISSDSNFGGNTVIFGHTPTKDGQPQIQANKVAIDTGAGYDGPLTAVGLPIPYNPAKVLVLQAK
jgi:serine/threonine protein phosphatase 1